MQKLFVWNDDVEISVAVENSAVKSRLAKHFLATSEV
jgi:hypothetical protein